ncbi:MAG: sigma-70 family RNA polymerase sigma factor [Candidatus Hydrogenedentes bacterium]|nr:sigma-70 family RNA polymerase sigma factor [Candidatus Hydrogenedentota bacterium]
MAVTTAIAGYWPGMESIPAKEQSDKALIERTRAGDIEAFSELARRHEQTVYNLALRFMRNPSLAEDMAQEAFLKAYQKLDKFRGDARFSTWLYRIVCNVCLTELQKRKRRHALSAPEAPEYSETPDIAAAQADEAEFIRRCVAQLPKRYAEAITLYYLQNCSYEEVAQIMKVPQGTLKTWMHRARKHLRHIVEQHWKQGHES